MNRMLLFPCLICAAAFVGWCLLATPDLEDIKQSKSGNASLNAGNLKDASADSHVTGESANLEENLKREQTETAARLSGVWDEVNKDRSFAEQFSRKTVVRPQARYFASIEFSDQQAMTGMLVGTLALSRGDETLNFPVIVDRQSGVASIFAARDWHSFDSWVKSSEGLF